MNDNVIDIEAIRAKRRRRQVRINGKTHEVRVLSLGALEEFDGADLDNVARIRGIIEMLFGPGSWEDFRSCDVPELRTIIKALIPGSQPDWQPDDEGLVALMEGLTGKKKEAELAPREGDPAGADARGPGDGGDEHGSG